MAISMQLSGRIGDKNIWTYHRSGLHDICDTYVCWVECSNPIGSTHVSYHVCAQRCPETLQLSRGHIGWEQHGGKGALSHTQAWPVRCVHPHEAFFHLAGPFLCPTTLEKRPQALGAKKKGQRWVWVYIYIFARVVVSLRNAAVLGTQDGFMVIITTLDRTGTSECGADCMGTMAAESVSQLEF